MKRIATIFLCLVLLVSVFPMGVITVSAEEEYTEAELQEMFGPMTTVEYVGTADYQKAYETFELINSVRAEAGKSALKMDAKLTEAAMKRAAESAVLFTHVRPNATMYDTVVSGYKILGECLMTNTDTVLDMVQACMEAEEYKKLFLDSHGKTSRSVGVGVVAVGSTCYWSILFSETKQKSAVKQFDAVPDTRFSIRVRTKLLVFQANATEVELDKQENFALEIGNVNAFFPLEAIPLCVDGFVYETSNAAVATVDKVGVITAVDSGNATISVKDRDGLLLFQVSVTVLSDHLTVYMSTTTTGKPKVVWNRVSGATHYRIYRKLYKDGAWTEYKRKLTTEDLSWVDSHIQPGEKAGYVVYAYKDEEQLDKQSVTTMYLSKPNVSTYNGEKGVVLHWSNVTGASYYKVYRRVYTNKKWSAPTLYKTTKATTYTDTHLKTNTKVQYYVYACNGDYRSAAGKDDITYLAVVKPTLANAANGVKVSWKSNGGTQYEVYRSVYSNGKWGRARYVGETKKGVLTYTDTKVKAGQRVKYFVVGQKGDTVSDRGAGKSGRYLKQPTIKLSKATKGVKVSWKKVTGATSYKIYRSVYKNGKWTDYVQYKTTKSTSYTDTSIKVGTRVRYTVYAYNDTYKSAYKTGISIKR